MIARDEVSRVSMLLQSTDTPSDMQVRMTIVFLLAGIANSAVAVEVKVAAIAGNPYGVATIEVPVATPVAGKVLAPIEATDDDGRVLYPIAHDIRVRVPRTSERAVPLPGGGRLLSRVGNLIRDLSGEEVNLDKTVARRVTFLFKGTQSLTVRLSESGREVGVYNLPINDDPGIKSQLLTDWWDAYTAAAKRQIETSDYPPWGETYLIAMLSKRTGMPLPQWYRENQSNDEQLLDTLKLVAGAKGAAEPIFRRAATGDVRGTEEATLPLPAPPQWEPKIAQENLENVSVEPLATRVPPECAYIRYGAFENYLWFRDLSDEYGGDLGRMLTLRGTDDNATQRVEQQLSMKMTQLSRMLGPTIIEDQALISRDLYTFDGASIGVILKTTNAFLLRTSLNNDRASRANGDASITLTELKIAGRDATLLRSSDNRVRSFAVEDDGYFLVTNSRRMAERFLEVGESGQSLASTPAFRMSRQLMPVTRDDTIFAYFSPEMQQGLVEPEYMIELRRRLLAKADISLVHLGRLAAAAEGTPIRGIDELTAAGFLPRDFGFRPDGSGVVSVGDAVVDTLRGARGTFQPIADAKIESVTAEEAEWYAQIASAYSSDFPQMDPIMVGLQRRTNPATPGIEQLYVHAEIAPLIPEKYGKWAQQLGPPTRVAMKFSPDDIVTLQAHVASEQIGPPTHLFVGIKDTVPPSPDDFGGILKSYWALRQLPGYLGAWPQPGALDRLPLGLGRGRPVGPSMSRLIGGLYRYTDDGFSILSFQPSVLQASVPFIAATEVDDSAQIRAHVGNLAGSQLEGWVNGQLYDLASESSRAGANFLSMLTRQLKVPPQEAQVQAERILGSNLQCSLGGTYEYSPTTNRWISTAWQGESPPTVAPEDYVAPAMTWFRGADATLTQFADRVVVDAVANIARK